MQIFLKKIMPHGIAALVFLIVVGIYTAPVFSGKKLIQHDSIQAQAGAQEVKQYHEASGEWSRWTNSMFGGMPTYMIAGDHPNSLGTMLGRFSLSWLPTPTNVLFIQMFSMYILLLVLGCSSWLSIIGGIAYGFGCYTLIFIEAGHISKIIATAFAPLVLAGVVWSMKGRLWAGMALLAVGMALEIYANHIQITYFLTMAVVLYVLWEATNLIKAGKTTFLLKSLAGMALAAGIGAATNTQRLWGAFEYSKESTRGPSELTISADSSQKAASPKAGLDRDYAFNYSHGIGESLTLLIPNYNGGSSQGGLGKNSATYKAMTDAGVDPAAAQDFVEKAAPVYWGPQASGAAAYAGSIILFLFVLSFFVVRSDIKWYFLVISTLFLAFGWGKYFSWFNYFMFDYFPLFNKFRDNKMSMILMQMFLTAGAILSLKHIFGEKPSFESLKKPLLISLALTAGLALVLGLGGGIFFDFNSQADSYLEQMVGSKEMAATLQAALKDDRASLLRMDSLRTVAFIVLAALAIYLFLKNKIRANVAILAIGALVLIDFFGYNKRYLNNDDFVTKAVADEQFSTRPVDDQILQDKDPNYRVADFTTNFWSDAKPSYFHKSVSGYHGAKLKRTQELFDFQISKNNMEALNMLNTKYFIMADDKGNPQAQLNPNARGNAWFVRTFEIVPDANSEIRGLDKLNTKDKALVDKRFEDQLKGLQILYDSTNTIKLTEYKPNKLSYTSNAKTEQLAVFSEIYYKGNTDWKAYIDGKESPHIRADYVLRAMRIPAGTHKIEFVFDPLVIKKGQKIDLTMSILMVLLVGAAIFFEIKGKK